MQNLFEMLRFHADRGFSFRALKQAENDQRVRRGSRLGNSWFLHRFSALFLLFSFCVLSLKHHELSHDSVTVGEHGPCFACFFKVRFDVR